MTAPVTRVEYGVECGVETYWPVWTGPFSRFRVVRWFMTRWLAWDCDMLNDLYGCGKHRVVKRTITERVLAPEEEG